MKKVNFYSEEEIQEIKTGLENGESPYKFARTFSEKTNRPFQGVYFKISSIKKRLDNNEVVTATRRKPAKVNRTPKSVSRPIKKLAPPKRENKPNMINVPSPEKGMVITLYPKIGRAHV